MRALLLACLLLALPAAEWSGRILVEETVQRPEASAALKVELDRLIENMQKRLDTVKAELAVASAAERRLLVQDLASFRAEILRARRERGGTVRLGVREYRLEAGQTGRALLLSDGSAVLADRGSNRAELVVDGETRSARLAVVPPVALADTPGPERHGVASRVHQLDIAGQSYRVEVLPGLPNPYAAALIEGTDAGLAQALAALPGLPAQVIGQRADGEHRLIVTAVEPRNFTAAELALPAAP